MVSSRHPERVWQKPAVVDGIIAAAFAALALLNLHIQWDAAPPPFSYGLAVALTLVVLLPLTWRRRFPLPVLAFITAALLVYRHLDIPEGTITAYGLLLALFSAGAYGGDRWRNRVRAVCMAAVFLNIFYFVFASGGDWIFPEETFWPQMLAVVYNIFLFGAAWWTGDLMRTSRRRESALRESTLQLTEERGENQRRAVLEERVRISRELHDVVAHHVSVIGIQAGAARHVMGREPEKAAEALSIIEASSRDAVNEMQRIIGFLRRESVPEDRQPQPSLERLDELVSSIRRAGLPVEVTVSGNVSALPPGVDLSAYRIIQEALTNALKHAGPARARVGITYGEEALELEISDNGQGDKETRIKNRGSGILGMRERVKLHGGQFLAGPGAEAGFRVVASLPFREGSA